MDCVYLCVCLELWCTVATCLDELNWILIRGLLQTYNSVLHGGPELPTERATSACIVCDSTVVLYAWIILGMINICFCLVFVYLEIFFGLVSPQSAIAVLS